MCPISSIAYATDELRTCNKIPRLHQDSNRPVLRRLGLNVRISLRKKRKGIVTYPAVTVTVTWVGFVTPPPEAVTVTA